MEKYYVIDNSDGDSRVTEYSKKELEYAINAEEILGTFFDKYPAEPDTNYWRDTKLIIKGEVVFPKIVQKVTEYELP
jgi:hypothetical protein